MSRQSGIRRETGDRKVDSKDKSYAAELSTQRRMRCRRKKVSPQTKPASVIPVSEFDRVRTGWHIPGRRQRGKERRMEVRRDRRLSMASTYQKRHAAAQQNICLGAKGVRGAAVSPGEGENERYRAWRRGR